MIGDVLPCISRPARTTLPPKYCPTAWCPRHTPKIGLRPAKAPKISSVAPAPLGVHRARRTQKPDGLVSEAHPEDRLAPGKGTDDLERDAGVARRARARRQQDAVGFQRQGALWGDRVVAEHPLLHAQLPEILDEVVRERIEVIDDEEHGLPIDPRLTRGSRMRVGSCRLIWQVTFNCWRRTRRRGRAAAGWTRCTAPWRPRCSCRSGRRGP